MARDIVYHRLQRVKPRKGFRDKDTKQAQAGIGQIIERPSYMAKNTKLLEREGYIDLGPVKKIRRCQRERK